jgi:hypothetical protein
VTQQVTGGYVRHRDRMVQESVFQDLRDTLIACRWLAGTTAQPVRDPYNANAWGIVTTTSDQTLALLEDNPLILIDYFPGAEEEGAATGDPASGQTALNTFALDNGSRIDSNARELGNPTAEYVTYRFNMAFFAASDAVAQAVFSDIADRFRGRLVRPDFIELWDYNSTSDLPVVRMDVGSFSFTSNEDQNIAPYEVHLYFGELHLEDEVD